MFTIGALGAMAPAVHADADKLGIQEGRHYRPNEPRPHPVVVDPYHAPRDNPRDDRHDYPRHDPHDYPRYRDGDIVEIAARVLHDSRVMFLEVERAHFPSSRVRKEMVDRFEDVYERAEDFYNEIDDHPYAPHEARGDYLRLVEEYREMLQVVNRIRGGVEFYRAQSRMADSMNRLSALYERRHAPHGPQWRDLSGLARETYLAADHAYEQLRSDGRHRFASHGRGYRDVIRQMEDLRDEAREFYEVARHERPNSSHVERHFESLVREHEKAARYAHLMDLHARRDFDRVGSLIYRMRPMVGALCRVG